MATSKTLTPTNETISIPAMTDQPDASVFSNCIDKEADAINALNSKLAYSNTVFNVTHANITDAERKSIRKYGRVCVIDLTFTVGTDITGDTAELFNGLPPAANETRFRLPHGYDATKPPLVLAITTGGKIINQWSSGGVRTGQWAGQAVYISAE